MVTGVMSKSEVGCDGSDKRTALRRRPGPTPGQRFVRLPWRLPAGAGMHLENRLDQPGLPWSPTGGFPGRLAPRKTRGNPPRIVGLTIAIPRRVDNFLAPIDMPNISLLSNDYRETSAAWHEVSRKSTTPPPKRPSRAAKESPFGSGQVDRPAPRSTLQTTRKGTRASLRR